MSVMSESQATAVDGEDKDDETDAVAGKRAGATRKAAAKTTTTTTRLKGEGEDEELRLLRE